MRKLLAVTALTVLATTATGCGWRYRAGHPCGCAPTAVPPGVEAPYYASPQQPPAYGAPGYLPPQQDGASGQYAPPQNYSPAPGQ